MWRLWKLKDKNPCNARTHRAREGLFQLCQNGVLLNASSPFLENLRLFRNSLREFSKNLRIFHYILLHFSPSLRAILPCTQSSKQLLYYRLSIYSFYLEKNSLSALPKNRVHGISTLKQQPIIIMKNKVHHIFDIFPMLFCTNYLF